MSMQPRWLRSAIAASAQPVPPMLWQRASRMKPLVPQKPIVAAPVRKTAIAAN